MTSKSREPYPHKPDGFEFVARFPTSKDYPGYTEMIITEDGILVCYCSDGQWWPWRKATEADRQVSKTCFRTWWDMLTLNGEMMMAA